MRWRWKIARAAGIDVFLHWSFLLAPIYVVFDGRRMGLDWSAVGLMLILLLVVFACVLLHEFGHALMARRFKIATKDIIITPIGGLARLSGLPRNPFQEFWVTIAGPLVNLALAGIAALAIWLSGGQLEPPQKFASAADLGRIFVWLNLVLFAFNLIPAFPMDGGRLLRSGLAMFTNHLTATRIAGLLGQLLAVAGVIIGLVYKHYPLLFIGIFVFIVASSEVGMAKEQYRRNLNDDRPKPTF